MDIKEILGWISVFAYIVVMACLFGWIFISGMRGDK
jgi:hypothetical protein